MYQQYNIKCARLVRVQHLRRGANAEYNIPDAAKHQMRVNMI